MTAPSPLLAASTERLAEVIAEALDVSGEHPAIPIAMEDRIADALLASGAVVPAASLAHDEALVDHLTTYLHDECDMGGAATFHTANLLRELAAALEDR